MQALPLRTTPETPPELPPAITRVLRRVPNGVFRARLLKVLTAASRAISKLRAIELTRIERMASAPESGALVLWEEAAPAVGASITDVNSLLSTIEDQFPFDDEGEAADDIDLAFGSFEESAPAEPTGPSIPTTPEERQNAAEKAIHDIASSLRLEVSRFGTRVRNPSVMTDPWNLLVDIQEFRGKCRAAIGELVYASLSIFEEISRAEVVPEYAKDVSDGIAVRTAWATLNRAVGPLNTRLSTATPEQQVQLLQAVQFELDLFRASRAYQAMRAGDKRHVLTFAADLSRVVAEKKTGRQAQLLVEGFAKFLDSLAVINRREVLMNHDREAFAECGTLLEQASFCLSLEEPARGLAKLTQAFAVATRLFGRDHGLDEYLVLRQRWPPSQLSDSALSAVIEELRTCLAESGSHSPTSMF
jgi:hypothetical protein